MKLTARTISTASIRVPTNSLTEPETTLAWSWNWCSSSPAGSSARISSLAAFSALPRTMMSPPRAIEMPSAITGLPWSRTFTCGGSTVPRLISAMSPSLKAAPPARIGNSFSCSSELNWPATRTWTESLGRVIVPLDSTAFCWPSCARTWLKSRPSWASRRCEISTNTFSSWAPKIATLLTSLTLSRRWRTRSAWSFSSASLKPSAESE